MGEPKVAIHDVLYGKDQITQDDKDQIRKAIDRFNSENGICFRSIDVSDNNGKIVYSYYLSSIPEEAKCFRL